jgi:hypothetical protein
MKSFTQYISESKSLKTKLTPADYARAKEIAAGKRELDDAMYNKLYALMAKDMPYGTAKARTGDPMNWIADHIGEYVEADSDVISETLTPVEKKMKPFDYGYAAQKRGIMCSCSRDKDFLKWCLNMEKQNKEGLPQLPSAGATAAWKAGWHSAEQEDI